MTIALCIVGYFVAGFLVCCLIEKIEMTELPDPFFFGVFLWPLIVVIVVLANNMKKASKLRRWIRGF